MTHRLNILCALWLLATAALPARAAAPLVLYTDFGLGDGAVSAMKGVAYGVSQSLLISDLSHQDPGILFAGAYRLYQVENYWPAGTVFVTVIDPGVGTDRLSVVLQTKTGHYFVAPNNGLLTLVAERDGIQALRQVDESVNRLPGSEESYTFHGRDVFGYTGARLAAGVISFEQVGPLLPPETLISIPYRHPAQQDGRLTGIVPVLDIAYGNVWTNIPKTLFDQLGVPYGNPVRLTFFRNGRRVHSVTAPYQRTFGDVPVGRPVVYINSLLCVALALNQGNYAAAHRIGSGVDWTVEIAKP